MGLISSRQIRACVSAAKSRCNETTLPILVLRHVCFVRALWHGTGSEENGQNKCPPAPAKCYNWTKTLWRGFQHFHTHAGQKVVGEAPGGWLQLRDALDYSDTDRFPVAQFGGPVNRSNTARLQKIVAQYSSMGAGVDDVASATGSRHFSRSRKGINNAGWRVSRVLLLAFCFVWHKAGSDICLGLSPTSPLSDT